MEWNHLSRPYPCVLSTVQSPNWTLTHLDGTLFLLSSPLTAHQPRLPCARLDKLQTHADTLASPDNKALGTMFLKKKRLALEADVSGSPDSCVSTECSNALLDDRAVGAAEIDEVAQVSCCGPIGSGFL